MANFLLQFQTAKHGFSHLIISVEDVSNLWLAVRDEFQNHLLFKKARLQNKAHNTVTVECLPVEFILTTDARLRSRLQHEQSLFCFREPYATIVLISCEDLDEFKNILKSRLKLILQADEREWFIVFVSKAHPSDDHSMKLSKKIFAKIDAEFGSKRKDRCLKLDMHSCDSAFWCDLESRIIDSIKNTLDTRVIFYEEEIHRLSEHQYLPIWSFCNFFILKESLAFMLEMAHIYEDALHEYDELEHCYMEIVGTRTRLEKHMEFGGLDQGDDQAALLKPTNKPLSLIFHDDCFKEFDFRQYLFACQAKLLFKLKRPVEVASRGYSFIISFSRTLMLHENSLPFCLREIWTVTACLTLFTATCSSYNSQLAHSDMDKEFHQLKGDLLSLSRVKFIRLAYLIGYGNDIYRTPANSAALSMLSWPKPGVWPAIPVDASSAVFDKEILLQSCPRIWHFNIRQKPLTLEPCLLVREANRRRASLSAGHTFEIHGDWHSEWQSNYSVDRPMKISEIHVAAEHALKSTLSNSDLWQWLSSLENFERKYLELTKGVADNYHQSWWKRHGVIFEGEIALIYFKNGDFDLAAKSFEKVCALYAGEGWEDLLSDLLPHLAECQRILNDDAGYLTSCVRLLSLDRGLFLPKERESFQAEVVQLAKCEMKHPITLDFSSLLIFSGNSGPSLDVCAGDPASLVLSIWSGLANAIVVESLSLSLSSTPALDESDGVLATGNSSSTTIMSGKNMVIFGLTTKKPGTYVLGVLTGQIGHLRFRSHSFSRSGPNETDDFMSYEKPTRPVLKVSKPRSLVDISLVVSSGLLINEFQWVGLNIKPTSYSLKGADLYINSGSGLLVDGSGIELDICKRPVSEDENNSVSSNHEHVLLSHEKGKLSLPDFASNSVSLLWLPVRAIGNRQDTEYLQGRSIVDGMRTLAVKLIFGVLRNQVFERTYAVHFTYPLHVTSRVVENLGHGNLLLQLTLHSQVRAKLTIYDTWLELQSGYVHIGRGDGRPMSCSFPFSICPSSRAAIIFAVRMMLKPEQGESEGQCCNILNVRYGIHGDRTVGAHSPVASLNCTDADCSCDQALLSFELAIQISLPVKDPWLEIAFLPFWADALRAGQLVTLQWKVLWLTGVEIANKCDAFNYEVKLNPISWMMAGRKQGCVPLPRRRGSSVVISVKVVPLLAGYLHLPELCFNNLEEGCVSCSTAGPRSIHVLPPLMSVSFCLSA